MLKHNFFNRHKYNAKQTTIDNIIFPSKKEADYYCNLKLRQKSGEVLFFLRQIPFYLPGGIIYRCDFLEFRTDNSVHFIETKGMKTPDFKLKMQLVEEAYPLVEIEII